MATVSWVVHALAAGAPLGLVATFASADALFTSHVAAMAITFLLLLPEGLILASRAYGHKQRGALLRRHLYAELAAVAAAISGFAAIVLQRARLSEPHFDTWHGRLGAGTLLGTELVAALGLLLYYGIPRGVRAKYPALVAAHRVAGKLMYVLAAATILTALQVLNPSHRRHKGWVTYLLAAAIAAQVAGMHRVLWPLLPRAKARPSAAASGASYSVAAAGSATAPDSAATKDAAGIV